jgi:hypothetical protein
MGTYLHFLAQTLHTRRTSAVLGIAPGRDKVRQEVGRHNIGMR